MKRIAQLLLVLLVACTSNGQTKGQQENSISLQEVTRIEKMLASDELKGRKAGTAEIDKAARFIAAEFKKAGLQPLSGTDYLQKFSMLRPRIKSLKAKFNGIDLAPADIIIATRESEIKIDEKSGYATHFIKPGESFRSRIQEIMAQGKDAIIFVDTSFSRTFPRLSAFGGQAFMADEKGKGSGNSNTFVYILGSYQPVEFSIKAEQSFEETRYANVVGILPGKSRKNEYVMFSAHYDHLGVTKQPVEGDSIYNGANDDAAGTTAVIMLADHFRKLRNNERTLVFAAFTAEESGGFGSRYFSNQFKPEQIMAMFNIEMIGTQSKWGENSAYITGFEKSDMGSILQKNLEGSAFMFYPDPYPDQNLFYRSDNATLARQGVPAHTISTSKMDNEPNYHRLSDEIETLDLRNMTEIIRAIALSSAGIVSGKETPSRVDVKSLR